MKNLLIFVMMVLITTLAFNVQADPQSDVTSNIINSPMSVDGYQIGSASTSKVGFYGNTPVVQRTDASQAAITDNAAGTVTDTIAVGSSYQILSFPLTLANISDADVVTTFVPGFKFEIVSAHFVVDTPVSTGSKASTLNLEIGTTDVTGGVLSLTSAGLGTLGGVLDATAITANATGSSTDSVSIEATATTTFIEGTGSIQLVVKNLDNADAISSLADKWNELRTVLTNLGLIAGE